MEEKRRKNIKVKKNYTIEENETFDEIIDIHKNTLKKLVSSNIFSLNSTQLKIISLIEKCEFDLTEVAKKMGVSYTVVYYHIYKADEKLKEFFELWKSYYSQIALASALKLVKTGNVEMTKFLLTHLEESFRHEKLFELQRQNLTQINIKIADNNIKTENTEENGE